MAEQVIYTRNTPNYPACRCCWHACQYCWIVCLVEVAAGRQGHAGHLEPCPLLGPVRLLARLVLCQLGSMIIAEALDVVPLHPAVFLAERKQSNVMVSEGTSKLHDIAVDAMIHPEANRHVRPQALEAPKVVLNNDSVGLNLLVLALVVGVEVTAGGLLLWMDEAPMRTGTLVPAVDKDGPIPPLVLVLDVVVVWQLQLCIGLLHPGWYGRQGCS